MIGIVLQVLTIDKKKELVDCFDNSEIKIIPKAKNVCVELQYPIILQDECYKRLPHGIEVNISMDSLLDTGTGVQSFLIESFNDYQFGKTKEICVLCNHALCTQIADTSSVEIFISSETHFAEIDIISIEIDRLSPQCFSPQIVSFDEESVCFVMTLSENDECDAIYVSAGNLNIDKISYQFVLDDGSIVREIDVVPKNESEGVLFSDAQATVELCNDFLSPIDVRDSYITYFTLTIKKSIGAFPIDENLEFLEQRFPITQDVVTKLTLNLQSNALDIKIEYDAVVSEQLNELIYGYIAAEKLQNVIIKVSFYAQTDKKYYELFQVVPQFLFGVDIGMVVCDDTTNKQYCLEILAELFKYKQSDLLVQGKIMFIDKDDKMLLGMLYEIEEFRFSCLSNAISYVYYDRVVTVAQISDASCFSGVAIKDATLNWRGPEAGESYTFTNYTIANNSTTFYSPKFEGLYKRSIGENSVLIYINLGVDSIYSQAIYYDDETYKEGISLICIIVTTSVAVVIGVVMIFDHRIKFIIQRGQKRKHRLAGGLPAEDDL